MDRRRRAGEALKAKGRALMRETALIGGRWVRGEGEIAVDDPAEETIIGTVPKLSAAQVEQAIDAADSAFKDYRAWTPIRRAEFLHRWAALIDQHAEAIGALISLENGKPFVEGLGEARYANAFIKWFAGEAERITGAVIETSAGDTVADLPRAGRPGGGDHAVELPRRHADAQGRRRLRGRLHAGRQAGLGHALHHARARRARAGSRDCRKASSTSSPANRRVVGGALTGSDKIRKLSFTGSTEVGRKLAAQCAPTLKRLSMELGGAAPLIVFEDADIATAVDGTVRGKYRAGGQTCVCPNRIYVHHRVKDAYLEGLVAAVQALEGRQAVR